MPSHLEQAKRMLDSADPLDPMAVTELAVAVREAPPADEETARQLQPVLQSLIARTREQLKDTGAALRKLRENRRGLAGYGHLKATRSGQSASKTA